MSRMVSNSTPLPGLSEKRPPVSDLLKCPPVRAVKSSSRSFQRTQLFSSISRLVALKDERKAEAEKGKRERQQTIDESLAAHRAVYRAERDGENPEAAKKKAIEEVRAKYAGMTASEAQLREETRQQKREQAKRAKEEREFRKHIERTNSAQEIAKRNRKSSTASEIRNLRKTTETSAENILAALAETKSMLTRVEDRHEENQMKLTLVSDGMKGAKEAIAEAVVARMKKNMEGSQKAKPDESHLSKWQRKWRWAARRALVLNEVDKVRAELRRRKYPSSYWSAGIVQNTGLKSSQSSPADMGDSINALCKEVNNKKSPVQKSRRAASQKVGRSPLAKAGRRLIIDR